MLGPHSLEERRLRGMWLWVIRWQRQEVVHQILQVRAAQEPARFLKTFYLELLQCRAGDAGDGMA